MSIAVIIPTYNRAHILARALHSVLAQTRPADEICVVDDGSTDDTAELVARDFPQVSYCYQQNRGVSAARNTGIRRTRSSWIALLDSDDEWLPDKLDAQYQAGKAQPRYRLIHSDEIWIRRGVRVNAKHKHAKSGGDIFQRCLPRCVISPSAVMLKRDLFDEVGLFDESLPACEDYDLWLRICSRQPVLYVNSPLLIKYGGHPDQLSRQHWGMDRYRVQALDNLLQGAELTPQQQAATQTALEEKCRILLQGARKHGNTGLQRQLQTIMQKHKLALAS